MSGSISGLFQNRDDIAFAQRAARRHPNLDDAAGDRCGHRDLHLHGFEDNHRIADTDGRPRLCDDFPDIARHGRRDAVAAGGNVAFRHRHDFVGEETVESLGFPSIAFGIEGGLLAALRNRDIAGVGCEFRGVVRVGECLLLDL